MISCFLVVLEDGKQIYPERSRMEPIYSFCVQRAACSVRSPKDNVLRMDSCLRGNDKYGTLDGGKFFIKLKKQTQFVLSLMGVNACKEKIYGDLADGRADENKANSKFTLRQAQCRL